jgi:deoxyribodipyrimidine photo-lyase
MQAKRAAPSDAAGARAEKKATNAIPFIADTVNPKRCRMLTNTTTLPNDGKCVVYWMMRDQRMYDNYALLYAQGLAQEKNVPLVVVFNLVPKFLEATLRQYGFMLKGLEEVELQLRAKNIPFHLTMGNPVENVVDFARTQKAYALVADFSPLRVGMGWVNSVASVLDKGAQNIPLIQVDAHNVVPCWEASPKLEYGARTIRSKISQKIPEFLTPFPEPDSNSPSAMNGVSPINWTVTLASLQIDRSVPEVDWLRPGHAGAMEMLESFVNERLKDYSGKCASLFHRLS